ncbi:MAG: hypothetical protein ABIT20_25775 [Gemmatimonadaceae bacterium]
MTNQAGSRMLKAATIAFFVSYLLLGLLVFRDFGMSWDEIPTRRFGIMYVDHLVPNLAALDSIRAEGGPAYERFGPFFEIVLVRAERLLPALDLRPLFFGRHLATFLIFFAGVVIFHRFLRRRFGPGISLLASVCLVCSPQLFSHAFYNVKDISFLTMFVASMLTLDSLLSRPGWRTMIAHALVTVILLGTRVLGLFAMMLTGAAAFARRPTQRTVWTLFGYGVISLLLLPLAWPVLQIDFAGIISSAVMGTTSNPYLGANLFRGREISAAHLPWDYVPTWIVITTPVIITALFFVGAAAALVKVARHPKDYFFKEQQRDVLVLLWFFMPVVGCMVLRPTLYDGWRHLFFAYPAMVYLAAIGMETIAGYAETYAGAARRRTADAVLAVALLLCLTPVVNFMVRNHPFEHLYFNRFAGKDMQTVKQRFELDYWGLSYRQTLEYIVRTDSSRRIRVFPFTYPGRVNAALLPPRDRARIDLVFSPADADYVTTTYRSHPEGYPQSQEVYSVKVGNAAIASVFLGGLKSATAPAPPPPTTPSGVAPR